MKLLGMLVLTMACLVSGCRSYWSDRARDLEESFPCRVGWGGAYVSAQLTDNLSLSVGAGQSQVYDLYQLKYLGKETNIGVPFSFFVSPYLYSLKTYPNAAMGEEGGIDLMGLFHCLSFEDYSMSQSKEGPTLEDDSVAEYQRVAQLELMRESHNIALYRINYFAENAHTRLIDYFETKVCMAAGGYLSVGVNWGQFLDFLLGFAVIDIGCDDGRVK